MLLRLVIFSFIALTGCAQLNDLGNVLYTDSRQESANTQRVFDQRKAEIENHARSKQISWVEAAKLVRDLDRSLVGRGTWGFDSKDEEYHAYCIALAEQVDAGRLSYAQYDAMRTRRFNDVHQRR